MPRPLPKLTTKPTPRNLVAHSPKWPKMGPKVAAANRGGEKELTADPRNPLSRGKCSKTKKQYAKLGSLYLSSSLPLLLLLIARLPFSLSRSLSLCPSLSFPLPPPLLSFSRIYLLPNCFFRASAATCTTSRFSSIDYIKSRHLSTTQMEAQIFYWVQHLQLQLPLSSNKVTNLTRPSTFLLPPSCAPPPSLPFSLTVFVPSPPARSKPKDG